MAKTHVTMKVNGAEVEGLVEPRTLLVHFLRENLSLTGTHIGCETTHCGACTVDLDGMSVKSCTIFAVQAQGSEVTTIEGVANADGSLSALQEGFRMMHGLQCGFCTPGMIVRAQRLLKENPAPSEEEIRIGISGNLCRCTGYQNIVRAIQYAADKINGVEFSNYVDDVKLPGMLHGDFVRSPHAHARVKSINSEEALKVPGVLAVITAETLKTVNLAWMPTLAGDVQMVLADGKVLFQNQEVAFVVATDRYAADDGINKVVVEYEPLPALIDPFKAMDPDAPVLREDLAGKTSGAHGPRKHHNHIFEWTVGDKDLTDAAFR